jgi:hypothetical protein
MRKKLLRLSIVSLALAALTQPSIAFADGDCPGNITDGQTACHLVSGTSCESCTYNCGTVGVFYRWNMCGV